MAFTITLRHFNGWKIDKTWHVGTVKPESDGQFKVFQLQADGDELELIRATMMIPITKGNICKWEGDLANFIYINL